MIIRSTASLPPATVQVPTIGLDEAEKHLIQHKRLFDGFVAQLHTANSQHPNARAEILTLSIETSRLRVTWTTDASKLSSDEPYMFSTGLLGQLTCNDVAAGIERGALPYIASIHRQVISINALVRTAFNPWNRMTAMMKAMDEDAGALYLIVSQAAARDRVGR